MSENTTDWDRSDIPNDWTPISDMDAEGNPEGATFIMEGNHTINLIRYRVDKENDVITFFNAAVPELIKTLIDYQANNGR